MKKWIAMLLAFCLIFSITACKAKDNNNKQDPTSDSTNSSTGGADQSGDSAVRQRPMVSVSLPAVTKPFTADNGTVIFNYTYQNISMIVPDPDIADKVIIDFLTRIDQTNSVAESIYTAAKKSYSANSPWTPYICSITYSPQRIDMGVLSLFGNDVRYSGGAHSVTSGISVSYDLITGKALSLSDVLTEGTSADSICQLVINTLADLSAEVTLHSDYASTVTDYFSDKFSELDTWYLSQTGLCFYFSPYEIAPYSSGVVVAEIPYEKLTGIMEDAYFPAERDSASGTVYATSFDSADLESYSQFSEIVLNDDSDKILLYTDKSVYDVQLQSGIWSTNGKLYTPIYTAFAAHTLTPGDAIMVEAALTDANPALRLSYKTGNDTVSVFITKSSDGSISLTAGS